MRWSFFILLLIVPSVFGASIHGTVYDFSLNPVSAVVTIESPRQVMVATDGRYSFTVEQGKYIITAEVRSGDELIEGATEEVTVAGDVVLDLILFPVLDDTEVPDLSVDIELPEKKSKTIWWIIGIFALLFVIAVLLRVRKSKKNSSSPLPPQNVGSEDVQQENSTPHLDAEAQKVLTYIKTHKRTTQKDIRKEFPSSEAKISLILTELENRGLIQKIKKGRGNVIIAR